MKYYGNSEYIDSNLPFKFEGYPGFQNCKCAFWFGFDDSTNKIIPHKIIADADEIIHSSKNQIFKLTNTKLSLIFNHDSNLAILGTINFKEMKM